MEIVQYPLYLGNTPVEGNPFVPVYDKYSGNLIAEVSLADKKSIEKAIEMAVEASKPFRKMSAFARKQVLEHCVKRFTERFDELVETLCMEVGKPFADSKREVQRLIGTFKLAAEESTRIYGELLPLDITENTSDYVGGWKRVPIGPCLFITPFNFPLNLPAHKIAPAIAVGCPFILKPATLTPISAIIIGEILAETDLPPGAFSILPCSNEDAELMVSDDRLKLLSFTGSADVGWKLKSLAGKKQVILELGGNAGCIVDEHIDLDFVTERLVFGAFYQAGQSCISVQRIYAHHSIYDTLKQKLIHEISTLKSGDPKDPNNFIGPLISEKQAVRLMEWIEQAKKAGANVLTGGKRSGAILEATLLENVPTNHKIIQEEVFGPIAVLIPFSDFNEVLAAVNQSHYGLQAGVFTRDLFKAHLAWDTLDVGGVIINDTPSWRSDNMPYGGSKDSGIGREGVRFAIEHLTEIRMMVMRMST